MLVAKLYYNASRLENLYGLLVVKDGDSHHYWRLDTGDTALTTGTCSLQPVRA